MGSFDFCKIIKEFSKDYSPLEAIIRFIEDLVTHSLFQTLNICWAFLIQLTHNGRCYVLKIQRRIS